MKKQTKRYLSMALCLIMVLSVISMFHVTSQAASIIASGYCGGEGDGTNLSWTLDSEGKLTITGSGEMKDYSGISSTPWGNYRTQIKAIIFPTALTSIGNYAFQACENLNSLTDFNGVKHIGEYAFFYCSSLPSIKIPRSVTSIGDDAFAYCNSLNDVTIPGSLERIPASAFGSCSGLRTVSIQDGVKSIGLKAFMGCSSLDTVSIPNSIEHIEQYAFSDDVSLLHVGLPDDSINIDGDAFYNTGYYNEESNWSNNVLYLGNHLIVAKRELAGDYTVKDGTKTIAAHAFYYCENLTKITLPASLTRIGEGAFSGCSALADITAPDSITCIEVGAFTGTAYYNNESNWKNSLFYVGNHLIQAGRYGFAPDSSCFVKNGTKTIAELAFSSQDNMTSITIPNSVTNIGWYAFGNCNSLTDVYYTGSREEWQSIVIDRVNDPLLNAVLHCNTIHEHNPKAVAENNTFTSCDVGGTYELVSYCTVCGEELSRETVTIPAGTHSFGEWKNIDPYARVRSCIVCGNAEREETGPLTIDKIYENPADGVRIECSAEAFEEGTTLETQHWSFSDVANEAIYEAWYVAFKKNGVEVQPKVPVILKLLLPTGIKNKNALKLWHHVEDQWVLLDTWFEGDYICCVTDCFSPFTISSLEGEPFFVPEPTETHEHSFTSTITQAATCGHAGLMTNTCSCGVSFTETILATGKHTPGNTVIENVINPTGTADGSHDEVVYCTVCGSELQRTSIVDPKQIIPHTHTYTAAVTTEPTCTADGETTYTCSVCGDTYTEPIPATGEHEDADNDGYCDTCEEMMTGGQHCKFCGKIHTGLFGWLIKFFHSILAFFKR